MNEPTPDTCAKCGKPERRIDSGRLTQWLLVSTCSCNLPASFTSNSERSYKICQCCNRRVPESEEGSITQYILKPLKCRCAVPVLLPEKKPLSENTYKSHAIENFEELALPADKFPIERYKPIELLGKGSTGCVYKSVDRLLNKKVAIKILNIIDSASLIAFQKEAKATSKLKHKNIVSILDFGITKHQIPFMVFEYIDGTSLRNILVQRNHLTSEETIDIFSQIANALHYTNEKGIYHRDIKPENIILQKTITGFEAKLIDFGLAKTVLAEEGASNSKSNTFAAGTPFYMSPDIFAGFDYDTRSEIYSLGCVLFECIAGEPPFKGDTALETMAQHATVSPSAPSIKQPAEVPPGMDDLVLKCLAKTKQERFYSFKEIETALHDLQANESTESEKITKTRRKLRAVFRPAILAVLGGSVIGMVIHLQSEEGRNIPNSFSKTTNNTQSSARQKLDYHIESLDSRHLTRHEKFMKLSSGKTLLFETDTLNRKSFDNIDLSSVTNLDLYFCAITAPDTLCPIARTGKISSIHMIGCTGLSGKAIDKFVKTLLAREDCGNHLIHVDLRGSDVTDDDIKALSKLPGVRFLHLTGTDVTKESLNFLQGQRLQLLTILDTRINGNDLLKYRNFPELTTVYCSENQVSKAVLKSLEQTYPKTKFVVTSPLKPPNQGQVPYMDGYLKMVEPAN